jgi:hypothetical protein
MFGVRKLLITIASATACMLAITQAFGQFEIGWYTVDGGGAMNTTAGALSLSGTAGQPDVGVAVTGGAFSLTGGFWFNVVPGDCNSDGGVNLLDYAAFNACLSGPGVTPGGTGCPCFYFDDDLDIDLADFAALQTFFSGG